MRLQDPLTVIKGIGPKRAEPFQKVGITTVEDLLNYFPRGYDQFEAPKPIAEVTEGQAVISGTIAKDATVRRAGKMQLTEVQIRDESGTVKGVWFNSPFLKSVLRAGDCRIFRGRISVNRFGKTMEHPQFFAPQDYAALMGKLRPVYGLTSGLTSQMVTGTMEAALKDLSVLPEYLPSWIRKDYHLAEYNYALQTIHFPTDWQEMTFARHRLVFDEFFLFILAVRYLKDNNEVQENGCRIQSHPQVEEFLNQLPFSLTGAQQKCYEEILRDLTGPTLMNRLVQGDVGSGKTMIAILALMQMALNGWQGVMMAPTEVLAKQHSETFAKFFERANMPLRVELLTGSMTAKEKRLAYQRIAAHEVDIIIGTHAVIQEKVHFAKLGLVITDEQHRFGVRQRETLISKGEESAQVPPHVLVMSATPIPRTLAIILYGDLDISVIDEKPANRLPIKNCVIGKERRPKAYQFIIKQVREGRQAYVICPMVEESEGMEGENVLDYSRKLAKELPPEITIGVLHGRMKPSEKNKIMEEFSTGKIQVLVSTTVVEVGVDVPNATVMMIENAERFGLAQLHQLRGRIGRGQYQSYCMFINGSDASKVKRLEILNRSNDGFEIASEDLKLRGPGDIFGLRQSGLLDFTLGDIYTDAGILKEASQAADQILADDYLLEKEEHRLLKKKLDHYLEQRMEKLSL